MASIPHQDSSDFFRHTRTAPCPVCAGYDPSPSQRCWGKTWPGGKTLCTTTASPYPLKSGETGWMHYPPRNQEQYRGQEDRDPLPGPQAWRKLKPGETFFFHPYWLNGQRVYAVGRIITPLTEPDKHGKMHAKEVRQWRWQDGIWKSGLDGVTRFPYRVDDLAHYLKATVYLPEGEPKADLLRAWGKVAVCNSEGAGKWDAVNHQDSIYLKGRNAVIIPDCDSTGEGDTQKKVNALLAVGCRVKVVQLPGLQDHEDLVQWAEAGHTVDELDALVEAAPWQAPPDYSLEALMKKEFPPIEEIVPGLLYGGVTLLAAKPKIGKSWMAAGLGLALSNGGRALGQIAVSLRDVLYIALEDGARRFQNRIKTLSTSIRGLSYKHFDVRFDFPRWNQGGKEALEVWIAAHPKGLVIIDTLARFRPQDDARKRLYDNDYEALAPIADLSHQTDVSFVVITHTRKQAGEDFLDEVSGSTGLTGAVDNIWVLKRQRGQKEATLSTTSRDGEETEKALHFDPETCCWILDGDADTYVRTEERQQIINVLTKAAPKALSPKEIASEIDKEVNSVQQLLSKLRTAGAVITKGYGKYTIPPDQSSKSSKSDKDDQSTKSPESDTPDQSENLSDTPDKNKSDRASEDTLPRQEAASTETLTTLTAPTDPKADDGEGIPAGPVTQLPQDRDSVPIPGFDDDETPTAGKLKAQQKGWPVDPPPIWQPSWDSVVPWDRLARMVKSLKFPAVEDLGIAQGDSGAWYEFLNRAQNSQIAQMIARYKPLFQQQGGAS